MSVTVADLYRKETGRYTGVVVIYAGKVAGWMNKLRSPEHFSPGCVAVDADNIQFKAVGGDDYNGARKWRRTCNRPTENRSSNTARR